jgi:hypothetical protein
MISSRTMSAGRRLMTGLPALIAVILVSASALAQSDSNPKWDVFAGYQYLNPGGTVPTGADPNNPIPFKFPGMSRGLGGAVTYNLDSHWGAEGDLWYNWDPRSGTSEWTAGAGPRFIVRTEGLALFLHALGTLNRVSYESGLVTHNGIGIILGGGMDIPLGRMFSWRVFGVDYVWAQHNFANLAAPEFSSLRRPEFEGVRLRTGVVINWGGAEELVPAAS